jgi:hypothetical protein
MAKLKCKKCGAPLGAYQQKYCTRCSHGRWYSGRVKARRVRGIRDEYEPCPWRRLARMLKGYFDTHEEKRRENVVDCGYMDITPVDISRIKPIWKRND